MKLPSRSPTPSLAPSQLKMPYVTSIERRATEQGLEQGLERGLIVGQIQLLQRLLGQRESTREELVSVPLDRLSEQRDQLQSELEATRKQG